MVGCSFQQVQQVKGQKADLDAPWGGEPAVSETVSDMAAQWTALVPTAQSGTEREYGMAGLAAAVLVSTCPRWLRPQTLSHGFLSFQYCTPAYIVIHLQGQGHRHPHKER